MKQEKGITLLSLTLYMVVLVMVIAMLAIVSDMFFTNTNYINESGKYISEYNKFNMYFIEDVKNNKDVTGVTENEIVFEDGTTYTYKEGPDYGIYRNKVKICSNIALCKFNKTQKAEDSVTKNIIGVTIAIKSSKSFIIENDYVLKYW